MCKIMCMSGIKEDKVELAWKFVKAMAKELTTFQDRDGLGYAAVGSDGELFGERWFDNSDGFVKREPLTALDKNVLTKHRGMLNKSVSYNFFGQPMVEAINENNRDLCSIILHTRNATTEKVFMNTHPFVWEKTALIHNGMIHNANEVGLFQSTCDSEAILNAYIENDVMNKIENIQKAADLLKGYYACGVISSSDEGHIILDVFKDNKASLEAAFIRELDTIVYCTDLSKVKSACRELSLTIVSEYVVKPGFLCRYNAITGEVLDSVKFDPTGPKDGKSGKGGGNCTVVHGGKQRENNWSGAPGYDSKKSASFLPTVPKVVQTGGAEGTGDDEAAQDEAYRKEIRERYNQAKAGGAGTPSPLTGELIKTKAVVEFQDYLLDDKTGRWVKMYGNKNAGNESKG